MTNLDSIFKSREITLPTKVHLVKSMVFPVVSYGYENQTIKKAECLWTVVLEKNLENPLDCKVNQWILKEINSEYSLEELMLKLQYFGNLMQTADSLKKSLMLGKTEGRRRRGQQRMRCLDGITNSTDTSLSILREMVKVSKAWRAAVHRVT